MSALPPDTSGIRAHMGYRSSAGELEEGVCELEIGPQHLNMHGLLHGGVVSMLLDNACGVAIRRQFPNDAFKGVTVTLNVNFVCGATGGTVRATGRITGGGRSLKFAEAVLRDEEGQVMATGSATFRISRR
ncbi:MAG: PaaI family thioesterase [Rhodobacteraceae bacterium]|nr:PaaI family thioesterase [Paracoccaceae bacterium]MBR9823594.1 PaaI family thioesterase [Paracoccaceae bacterium]